MKMLLSSLFGFVFNFKLIILLSLSIAMSNHFYQKSYAHDFLVNNDITIVTLVEQIKAETELVNTNFLFNNNVSALGHARNAAELLKDLEDNMTEASEQSSSNLIQIYENEKTNTTSLALVTANIVDEVLRKYGTAFDIGYDLTNMSNMMRGDMPDVTSYPAPPSGSANNIDIPTNSTNQNNELRVVNIADYQSAQKLLEKAYQIFRGNLSLLPLSSNNTDPSIMAKLEKSMKDLSYLVEIKAPAQDLMTLVHGEIHPSLQLAYDLGLKQ